MKTDILKGYLPGCVGRITQLHSSYYHRHVGFGLYFETKVPSELADFQRRYDERRNGISTVVANGKIEGSIVIDGIRAQSEGAHLRWFIVSERLKGAGCGNALLDAAINFCRHRAYRRIYLCTFERLAAARHLYEKYGFRLIAEQRGVQWGVDVNEQCFELLDSTASNLSLRINAQSRQ